jgi:hypothetical protein
VKKMNYLTSRCLFSLALLLTTSLACADGNTIARILHQQPMLASFDMCQGGGCAEVSHVAITEAEWQKVTVIFDREPQDAEQERNKIAQAIGVIEDIVGAKTGTSNDRGGTFGNSAFRGQLDCNDEATNSTTYMKLMLQAGLLQFHKILDTKTRNFFFNGWPHTTAVIEDKQSKVRYAVDSWFYDNGMPAVIVPLTLWQSGWKPTNTAAH